MECPSVIFLSSKCSTRIEASRISSAESSVELVVGEPSEKLYYESAQFSRSKVLQWIQTCKFELAKEAFEVYDDDRKSNYSNSVISLSPKMNKTYNVPNSLSTNFVYSQQSDTKSSDSDVELVGIFSTETHKKELCNYLQLRKPEEDKPLEPLNKNRRSARFKAKIKQTNPEPYPTMKSLKDLKMNFSKIKEMIKSKLNSPLNVQNRLLPLPPKEIFENFVDFGDAIEPFVVEKTNNEKLIQETLELVEKKIKETKKLQNGINIRKFRKPKFIHKMKQKYRINRIALRSQRRLRNTAGRKLGTIRKLALRRKTKRIEKRTNRVDVKETPSLDKTIKRKIDDVNVDLKNFVDDILELEKMTEEHRNSVIESRLITFNAITNLIDKKDQSAEVQKALRIFLKFTNDHQTQVVGGSLSHEKMEEIHYSVANDQTNPKQTIIEETLGNEDISQNESEVGKDNSMENTDVADKIKTNGIVALPEIENNNNEETTIILENKEIAFCDDHNYAAFMSSDDEEEEEEEEENQSFCSSLSAGPMPDLEVIPINSNTQIKSLHRSLIFNKRGKTLLSNYGLPPWNSSVNAENKNSHSITISKSGGKVLKVHYQLYDLIITQQSLISFWTQSALGNALGAQNMWIPKGEIQRIALSGTYAQKTTTDMVISTETSVAYIELWTKEHKSDFREMPVADVFAIIYFWRVRQNGLEKKALQLENIKGLTDDVQYCVLKNYSRIIVSWYTGQGNEKRTKIHSYHLATDFQTVASISAIQPVDHYVASLHNIEDSDNLIMGCGEDKLTLWNVEYGYIIATIVMATITPSLATFCAKSDRGYLFTIQECADNELRLIAINGMNHSWKKLQTFKMDEFERITGVYMGNGILIAYYSRGLLCWNAQNGKFIAGEEHNDVEYFFSGNHVIILQNDNIIIRHSLTHLVADS